LQVRYLYQITGGNSKEWHVRDVETNQNKMENIRPGGPNILVTGKPSCNLTCITLYV